MKAALDVDSERVSRSSRHNAHLSGLLISIPGRSVSAGRFDLIVSLNLTDSWWINILVSQEVLVSQTLTLVHSGGYF